MFRGETLKRRFFLNDSVVSATILVRYGELALKSPPVRREFEHRLERNIAEAFVKARLSCRLRNDHGHLYVMTDEEGPSVRLLRRVFGVTSVSPVLEVDSDPIRIREALLSIAEPRLGPGCRFAIRARRTGQHTFTSQQLAADLGAAVLSRWPDRSLQVDLTTPQVELQVEVRGPRTYLSLERRSGPGGLPLGVAGNVVAVVDGVRGALGAFLMMKRGCKVSVFELPAGGPFGETVLRLFDPALPLRRPSGEGKAAGEEVRDFVRETRAEAVVLALQVDDFPAARAEWGETVVFSPTVGFTDEEVEQRWGQVVGLTN
jgi:tRNA uracil 4-sulfurtransferase